MENPYLSDKAKKSYDRDGYYVWNGFFDHHETEMLYEATRKLWIDKVMDKQIVQDTALPLVSLFPPHRGIVEGQLLWQYVVYPRILAVIGKLLGEKPLIVGSTCFYKPPGDKGLALHQDNYEIGALPEGTCAAWISIDKSEAVNGGLRFVPGSHKLGLISPVIPGHHSYYGQMVVVPPGYEVVPIETRPGDVVFFDGNAIHGSTANVSKDRWRRAFVTHYVRESTKSIYVNNNLLRNMDGDIVKRKFNKRHGITRMGQRKQTF